MQKLLSAIIAATIWATSAFAEDSFGPVTLRNLHKTDFTSNGSMDMENCTISSSLSVNGAANIEHSNIRSCIINGSLTASGIDVNTLHVIGGAILSHKSNIEELLVAGALLLEDARVDKITAVGSVYIKNSNVKKLDATSLDVVFENADLGLVSLSRDDSSFKAMIVKISGTSKFEHLTIKGKAKSKDKPVAIIMLDHETKKTFDKSKVTVTGFVEYR